MASVPQPIVQFERRLPMRVSGSFLQENGRKEGPLPVDTLSFIIGRQGGLRHILAQVKAVAPTNVTVLLIGERSEEHTSELQSPDHLVCRLLLEKKKKLCTPPVFKITVCFCDPSNSMWV